MQVQSSSSSSSSYQLIRKKEKSEYTERERASKTQTEERLEKGNGFMGSMESRESSGANRKRKEMGNGGHDAEENAGVRGDGPRIILGQRKGRLHSFDRTEKGKHMGYMGRVKQKRKWSNAATIT